MKVKPKEWNYIDQLIYSFESFLKREKEHAVSHRDEDIDTETMIAAETEHLKTENEELKKLQMPGRVLLIGNKYYCPHCREEIHSTLIEKYKTKYCPECGKRIILSKPCSFMSDEKLKS
ncbi:MAG: hypothetical protein NC429_00980 [Lachnospiraceae bacterium]|nr:hypothetical protein [Lachnospiraceae bacterium]